MGFAGASSIGLTFAAIGYLWACFAGVALIYYGVRRGWISEETMTIFSNKKLMTGIVAKDEKRVVGGELTTESEAIDSLSFHGAIVAATYFLSYLFLSALVWGLSFAGTGARELGNNLWGINFIFSALDRPNRPVYITKNGEPVDFRR